MSDWAIWFVFAGLAVVVELFTGTFYLLMIALGLAAGGAVALMQGALEWQLIGAALLGFLAVGLLRRSRFGRQRRLDAASDPNVLFDIGQSLHVEQWQDRDGVPTARVPYRGAQWNVELAAGHRPHAGHFIIREMRGSKLIVSSDVSSGAA